MLPDCPLQIFYRTANCRAGFIPFFYRRMNNLRSSRLQQLQNTDDEYTGHIVPPKSGVQIQYSLSKRFSLGTVFSTILGWVIYRRDEDILPRLSLQVIYNLRF